MAGITLNTRFNNPNLPISRPWASDILAMPNRIVWAQADVEYLTITGGKIATWLDRLGGAGRFEQTDAARRAALIDDQLSGFAAARFRGIDDAAATSLTEFYQLSGETLPADQPYTLVSLFKRATRNSADTLVGRSGGTGIAGYLNVVHQQSLVEIVHGSVSVQAPITEGDWHYAIGRFDGTTVHLNVNGFDQGSVAAAGTTGSSPVILGALQNVGNRAFDGLIADTMIFGRSISASEVESVKGYFRGAYGL